MFCFFLRMSLLIGRIIIISVHHGPKHKSLLSSSSCVTKQTTRHEHGLTEIETNVTRNVESVVVSIVDVVKTAKKKKRFLRTKNGTSYRYYDDRQRSRFLQSKERNRRDAFVRVKIHALVISSFERVSTLSVRRALHSSNARLLSSFEGEVDRR